MTAGRTRDLDARALLRSATQARLSGLATAALLVAALITNAALQDGFFSAYGMTSLFATVLPLATVAVAQVVVVLAGGIDLSVGTIVTLSSVVTVQLLDGQSSRAPIALAAGLAVGIACGLVNGLIVGVLRLQPIVATFATSFGYAGLALLVLPRAGGLVPSGITLPYRQVLAGFIPVTAILLAVLFGVWRVLYAHRFGRHLYAVGGNEQAAYASGVPVTLVRVGSYALGGLFAALAGFALLANTGAGDPFAGNTLTLEAVAAIVIGGTALAGGVGGAGGAIAGAMVFVLIRNIVFFAQVPQNARELVTGAITILAIALAGLLSSRRREVMLS